MTNIAEIPTDPVLTAARTERLHARIWERASSVRKSLTGAVAANEDRLVGQLSHGSAHITALSEGVRRNVLLKSAALSLFVLASVLTCAFGVAFASATLRLAPPEMPVLAVWPVVALGILVVLASLGAAAWAMRTLLQPNVDDLASAPRHLVEASAYALGVGGKGLYLGTVERGVAKVREIPYPALGRVEILVRGLRLYDTSGRPVARVEGCFEAGEEADHHAVVSFLREKIRG